MSPHFPQPTRASRVVGATGNEESRLPIQLEIALLTGGGDRHYAFGLAMGLVSRGVYVDFVGGDEVDSPELRCTAKLRFLNLRRNGRSDASLLKKISRMVIYYLRLIWYAAAARPRVFHILWNSKFEVFDRTLLMLYYKLLGKKVALTAHNVNAGTRDSTDSLVNRLTLRAQYRLADHIFVHTDKMKRELQVDFGVRDNAVTVIRHGINIAVPTTDLTPEDAKRRLGIGTGERTILFFGNIAPYKGLEYLIAAFEQLVSAGGNYRLIVAGRPKREDTYVERIRKMLDRDVNRRRTLARLELIPDADIELYFKAADVSVLPYTHIFQSGVLFLGYSFGLPVIATDVGSLREDIIESETGFVCRPQDSAQLAKTIEQYFSSELYRCLSTKRHEIRTLFTERHSWDGIAEMTRNVYAELLRDTELRAPRR